MLDRQYQSSILQESSGFVKTSAGVGDFGQTFCRQDCSDFLWKQAGLLQLSARVGHTFCRTQHNWSNSLQGWAGLVKLTTGTIGQTFCPSRKDWPRLFAGTCSFGQKLGRSKIFFFLNRLAHFRNVLLFCMRVWWQKERRTDPKDSNSKRNLFV